MKNLLSIAVLAVLVGVVAIATGPLGSQIMATLTGDKSTLIAAAGVGTSPTYDSLGNVDINGTAFSTGVPSYMQTNLNQGSAVLSKSLNVRVAQTNGNTILRPILLSSDISTNAPSPFSVINTGVDSVVNYGPMTSAVGTVQAFTSEIEVNNSGNNSNEFGNYVSFLVNNATANPGRMWVTDFNLQGPIGVQPNLMNGITMFMNNYYNGSPSWSPSGGLWVVTRQQSGGGLDATHSPYPTYPLDVGIGIVGTASSGLGRGFNTGLRIGGSGSGWDWSPSTGGSGQSKIGTAIELKDWDQNGILISGRYPGSSGPAFAIASGAGNVGIGTLTPVTPLEVVGNTSNSSAKFGTFEIQSYGINNAWLGDNVYYNGSNFVRRGNGYAAMSYFYLGGYEVRVNNSSGSAGSTFTPTRAFRVNPDGSVALGGNLNAFANNQLSGASAIVDTAGRLGTKTLAAGGSEPLCFSTTANSGWNTIATCSSDARLKKNIMTLDPAHSLAALMLLNPVSYMWNPAFSTDQRTQLGLLAQDVQQVLPDLVSKEAATLETPDGTLSINMNGLFAPIIAAIQELAGKSVRDDARIRDLEARVSALEAQLK